MKEPREKKVYQDDGWRIPEGLWLLIEPHLPPGKPHPLGCCRHREPDRKMMDAIFFVLRTGCQWKALDATGLAKGSTAHLRFQEWVRAGVFRKLWELGLLEYDRLQGIDWEWLSMDGAMTKSPLGGEKNRAKPYRPRKAWHQKERAV